MKLNVVNRLVKKEIKAKDEIILNFLKNKLQEYCTTNNIDITDKESVKKLFNKNAYQDDEYGVVMTYAEVIEYDLIIFINAEIISPIPKKIINLQGYHDWFWLSMDKQKEIFIKRLLQ